MPAVVVFGSGFISDVDGDGLNNVRPAGRPKNQHSLKVQWCSGVDGDS